MILGLENPVAMNAMITYMMTLQYLINIYQLIITNTRSDLLLYFYKTISMNILITRELLTYFWQRYIEIFIKKKTTLSLIT